MIRRAAIALVAWLLPLVALFASMGARIPLLARVRAPIDAAVCIFAAGAIVVWFARRRAMRRGRGARFSRSVRLALALTAALVVIGGELGHRRMRSTVLTADRATLARIGRHLIVGYLDAAGVRPLVESGAVGGIFVTARNARGRTHEAVRREIAELQALRRKSGLPDLIVATDQEGGRVSRLTPPLSAMPPLSSLVDDATRKDREKLRERARRYGDRQGRELANLGVTLNFAPVVDLRPRGKNLFLDPYSRIHLRAIAGDAATVVDVSRAYASALRRRGVLPTLKHFPGLGRADADTHFFRTAIDVSTRDLEAIDWLPFRRAGPRSAVMLGHVELPRIAPGELVSSSRQIVEGVLRRRLRVEGPLVTDDFCMLPVWTAPGGFRGAVVRALNAGVDLVLISFDPRQVYPALDALLDADRRGDLDEATLGRSRRRLDRAFGARVAPPARGDSVTASRDARVTRRGVSAAL